MSNEQQKFEVVINHEGQYSLWPQGKAMANGWSATGVRGERQACLDVIAERWTDMRPRSLRETEVRGQAPSCGERACPRSAAQQS
ncbi:MbtH family protein [Pseudomonas gingeri]|uniref:MbtH family NRPS accessory protein n=1 Tax=Pseudomonas gingeri TaxID=117681 RepID=A0A7Y7YAD5_9PSED|nr:MbtH family NRPS accessory protein [Pseudomonas gingeri]NWB26692.1 MbtH family NRPS accessory protein [Pseudomonas gingeri]NWC32758.1 MbtH family NRPS accessory protein [Pseudomonas gingeri]